ncbi:MAG: DNA polymerase III subunit delta, partial [Solirubrobacteraceae bacterium]|nr:DNA polymerase III subunit delta [Solirubrobacteraceae bacterium]
KPAYLFHGDDHGRIGERRAGLRTLAERGGDASALEVLEGEDATPEAAAAALQAMTFAMSRRVIIVDGAERWKDADVTAALVPALADMPPETTIAFFAREEGRFKVPPPLARAVEAAGGEVRAHGSMKAKELPRWAAGEAERLGISLDGEAAQVLVRLVGERQQRILRELEKLALEHGQGARLSAADVQDAVAQASEKQVWGFIDALVARDQRKATATFLELRAQGESMPRLVPLMARRVRELLGISLRIDAGEAPQDIKKTFKGSPWAADKRIAEARKADPQALRRAIEALADLELATRGGSELSEDTVALRAIDQIAA